MDGGDLFMAALGGMLGEELIRKIATRPFGFLVLWLAAFVLVNIFFITLGCFFIVLGIFTDPAAQESILRYLYDSFVLLATEIGPWMALLSLGMGFLLAISYWFHFRNNAKLKSESELIAKEDKK